MVTATSSRRSGLVGTAGLKSPCLAASTANLTLSGEQTVDGVALVEVSSDRCLVKNQTTASENGIYVVKTGTWQRALDWDGTDDITEGTQIISSRGTVNKNTMWRVTTTGNITIGTTAVAFEASTINVSSAVTYEPSGTGAVTTTVQTKLRESVSVKDFGATGDGVTDDTAAIQAAIDSGASHIIIPNTGSSYLFTTLTFNSASDNRMGMIFEGGMHTESGDIVSHLECTSTTATAFDVQDGNITFRHLRISASAARTASATTADGIHLRGDLTTQTIIGVVLDDIWVHNQPGHGIRATGCELCEFTGVNSNANGERGFFIESSGGASVGITNTYQTCRAFNNDLGGWYIESNHITFINCQSLENNQSITGAATTGREIDDRGRNNTWINPDVEAQVMYELTDSSARPDDMQGMSFAGRNCTVVGAMVGGFDTGIRTGTAVNTTIINPYFSNAGLTVNGNMTYGVDNNDNNTTVIYASDTGNSNSVDTFIRNNKFIGHLDNVWNRQSEVVTATNVITAGEGNMTFYLGAAGGFTSTLPAPARGLKFRFVVSVAPTTAYIITTNAGANILYGTINEITATAGVSLSARDTLNFVASTSLIGDWAEFESDGTNWYVNGSTQVDNGITVSVT